LDLLSAHPTTSFSPSRSVEARVNDPDLRE
jgi:hypothetical protein